MTQQPPLTYDIQQGVPPQQRQQQLQQQWQQQHPVSRPGRKVKPQNKETGVEVVFVGMCVGGAIFAVLFFVASIIVAGISDMTAMTASTVLFSLAFVCAIVAGIGCFLHMVCVKLRLWGL